MPAAAPPPYYAYFRERNLFTKSVIALTMRSSALISVYVNQFSLSPCAGVTQPNEHHYVNVTIIIIMVVLPTPIACAYPETHL